MEDGWAQRTHVQSIVFHYFRDGVSVCEREWSDPKSELYPQVPHGAKRCPQCVDLQNKKATSLREHPSGIGAVVLRRIGKNQTRPCIVTGWFGVTNQIRHYVLTPIPIGMTAKDLYEKFWPSIVDEMIEIEST